MPFLVLPVPRTVDVIALMKTTGERVCDVEA